MAGRFALLMPALAAAAVTGAPALGQCRLCESPTTERPDDRKSGVIAIQIDAGLDFDRLILLGPGEGTATLRPDGSQQVTGSIGSIGARAMVGQARLNGEPGRAVRVDLPERIELHSLRGGQIVIENIISDLPPAPKLDSTGVLEFRFGGRLVISGDAEGDYRGDVPITVEYL